MSDKLNFLHGQSAAEPEIVSEAPAVAEAPPAVEQAPEAPARGADGKFVAKASEAPPEPPPAPEAAPTPPEPQHAPISALLDERDKRKAAQEKAEALERQLQELRNQQPAPDLSPDERLEVALYQQNLRASRRFAEREYGKDVIAEVHTWAAQRCDADPIFNQQMLTAEDPYEAAYQAFNREKILAEVKPDDLAAFRAWQAAQAAASAQTPASPHTPTPAASTPPPPRSLADAPGNGGAGAPHIPIGPGEAFRAAITR